MDWTWHINVAYKMAKKELSLWQFFPELVSFYEPISLQGGAFCFDAAAVRLSHLLAGVRAGFSLRFCCHFRLFVCGFCFFRKQRAPMPAVGNYFYCTLMFTWLKRKAASKAQLACALCAFCRSGGYRAKCIIAGSKRKRRFPQCLGRNFRTTRKRCQAFKLERPAAWKFLKVKEMRKKVLYSWRLISRFALGLVLKAAEFLDRSWE